MRKVNFHTLENLAVPPELIEKALAIPASSENTPTVLPWYKRTRMIAAAASIVLVVLAGISVYFLFGNKNIPVKPSNASNRSDTVVPTLSDAEPTGSATTEPQSERPTGTAAQSATIDASSVTQPTVITPSGITAATEPRAIASSGVPATEPDNNRTNASGVPTPNHSADSATERPAPTEEATQNPVEQPTQAYETGTDQPEDPQIFPGNAGGNYPGAPAGGVIYSWVNGSLLTGNKRVYCVLYDRAGNRVDSDPILSPKHETFTSTQNDGYAYFNYIPPEEWNLSAGMYEMEIYNENGTMIRRTIVFFEA